MPYHHLAIATRDMAATHIFYSQAMGFDLVKAEIADRENSLRSGTPTGAAGK
jgi:catechol 2,3-dioxygenase-like lactoylglutathione lyase family enzyme